MLNENQQKLIKLNNGIEMPQIGFGVWKIPFNQTAKVVTDAIKNHYRLIDTEMKNRVVKELKTQGLSESSFSLLPRFLMGIKETSISFGMPLMSN